MTSGKSFHGLRPISGDRSASGSRAKGEVLIVTADPISRIVIEGTLRRMGIASRSLDTSILAPEEADDPPAMIVFDCSDSTELCRKFASLFTARNRPRLIVISDDATPQVVPADTILRKPIIPDRLEQAVYSLLDTRD